MKTCIIIPARKASSRFPDKMMHHLAGTPLIVWTWRQAMRTGFPVFVATDDSEIAHCAAYHGARVILTGDAANGTERCALALAEIGGGFDIVINWQGDSPLVPHNWARAVANHLVTAMAFDVVTAGYAGKSHPGLVRVVEHEGMALHFERCTYPWDRPTIGHAGLYAMRGDTLRRYGTKATAGEIAHGLEQNRWLDQGVAVGLVRVDNPDYVMREVNLPADIQPVEQSLRMIHEIA